MPQTGSSPRAANGLNPIDLNLADAAATTALGYELGQRLPAGTILLLEGNLGGGKTTLVKGLGAGLGITETIDSPTFTLINEYLGGRLPLYHVDLYRLDTPAAIASLYLDSYWDEAEVEPGILAIEWAERLSPPLPPQPIGLKLAYTDLDGRQAQLQGSTPAQVELLNAVVQALRSTD